MNRKRDSKNSAISRILHRIDPISYKKTSTKMNIAAMIDDAMKAKGWSKKDLMEKMGKKNQSEITRWLSGTQNFTVDKLVELSLLLDIKLVAMYEEKKVYKFVNYIPTDRTINFSENETTNLDVNQDDRIVKFISESKIEYA